MTHKNMQHKRMMQEMAESHQLKPVTITIADLIWFSIALVLCIVVSVVSFVIFGL